MYYTFNLYCYYCNNNSNPQFMCINNNVTLSPRHALQPLIARPVPQILTKVNTMVDAMQLSCLNCWSSLTNFPSPSTTWIINQTRDGPSSFCAFCAVSITIHNNLGEVQFVVLLFSSFFILITFVKDGGK